MDLGSVPQSAPARAGLSGQRTAVITYNTSHYVLLFRKNLIRRLQAQGYRVVVVAPMDQHSTRFRDIGVEHVPIRMDNKGVNPVKDLALLADIYGVYRRVRPDVALHFTIKPNIYGSIVARALGIPVINNVTGLGTAFVRGGVLRRLTELLYGVAFRRAAVVFFQNEHDHALFREAGLVKAGQTEVLPGSGVDTNRFAPRAPATADGPFRFLFIGRIISDKGVCEYVEAARILKSRGIEVCAQILGQIGSENRGAIPRVTVQEWVDSGIVEYLGELEDVREAIAQADCIVLPSYREGTSKTLLEAASMAKPIVASDVPGCNNIVRSGVNGYLCRPADAAHLAEAMEKIVKMAPGLRERMGTEGRKLVVERFDETIVLERYSEALRRVGMED